MDPKSLLLASFLFHLIFLVIHRTISFIKWKAMYIIIFCNWAHAVLLVKMSLSDRLMRLLKASWSGTMNTPCVLPFSLKCNLKSWLSHQGGVRPRCFVFVSFVIYVPLSSPFFFHIVPFSLSQTFPSRLPQALDHAAPCAYNFIPSVTLKTHSYVSFSQ